MPELSQEEVQLDLVLSGFSREIKRFYTADPHADSSLIYQKALLETLNKTGCAIVKRNPPRYPNLSRVENDTESYDLAHYQLNPDKPIDETPDFVIVEDSGSSIPEILARGDRVFEEVTRIVERLGPV